MNEIKADVLKIPRKWNKTLARAVKKTSPVNNIRNI